MDMARSVNMAGGATGYVLELVRRIPGLEDAVAEGDLLLLTENGPVVRVEFRQRVRTPEAWSAIRGEDELAEKVSGNRGFGVSAHNGGACPQSAATPQI
jgi:hypothetical protein